MERARATRDARSDDVVQDPASPAVAPKTERLSMGDAQPSLAEFTRACFKIGCLGFGGPAGQIALMHRIFVDEKKWIDKRRYLAALNYCMLLPGPEAQQLATYVGWLLHGVKGGVIAGLLFVLPGAFVVFALSWLYVFAIHAPLVAAAFFGIKAAVFALVVEALWRIGRRALEHRAAWAIAVASFGALFFAQAPFPLVVSAGGAAGLLFVRAPHDEETAPIETPSTARAFASAAIWGAAWLAPLGLSFALLGPTHVLTEVGRLFSTLALVTFGGAYATLAYLQQQAVDVHAWLTPAQMIDGLGLAETTPGPLVLVNQFVGFIAGWQAEGLLLAIAAAAMASWCTFAPSFVWIFAGAPYAERLRASALAQAALAGITAAVLGVIANLSIWFAAHVLFANVTRAPIGPGLSTLWPAWATLDPYAFALAAIAAFALFRLKIGVVWLVLGSAAAGVALSLAGLN
ncbi:MAG: chromate efflux transporter [Hyphomonadaceae bacterium]